MPRMAMPTAAGQARSTQAAALDGGRSTAEARQLQAVARGGVSGPSRPFPHAERIRRAFGSHAPHSLRAHGGPTAAAAGQALSASGFVLDGRAAFAAPPSLRTAAHEAFHLVEQARSRPVPGVGARGDRSEVMADRVADAVAAGRSAEPLLQQALAAPPALQMDNTIKNIKGPKEDTPWKEIDSKLGLPAGTAAYGVTALNQSRFGPMVATLGDRCNRAEHVEATLDGGRPGPPRALLTNPMQSAFGALGSLEAALTNTGTPAKYEFEGGHLIADEMLGKDSYVEYNFAPQRGHLNAPIYRKIEEIAMHGIKKKKSSVKAAKPKTWSMDVKLKYPGSTYTVSTAHLRKLLGIAGSDISVKPVPKTLSLTSRVPSVWTSKVDSGNPGYVFSHESTIDKSDGAYAGYLGAETNVLAEEAKATTHLDANYWGMDSLTHTPTGKATGWGTGSLSSHTFTMVQAVPRGQTKLANTATPTLPAATPYAAPTLKRKRSFSEIPDGSSLPPTKRKKQLDELAGDIVAENTTGKTNALGDIGKTSLSQALLAISMLKKSKFTKADVIRYRGGKTRKGGQTKVAKAAALRDAQAKQIVLANFTNKKKTVTFV